MAWRGQAPPAVAGKSWRKAGKKEGEYKIKAESQETLG